MILMRIDVMIPCLLFFDYILMYIN